MKLKNLLIAVLMAAVANLLQPLGRWWRALSGRLIGYAWKVAAPSRMAHAMYDTQLFFRNTTDSLTATETSAALTINGTPSQGLAVVIDIPKKSVGDTVQALLDHSTDASTYTTLATFETVASVAAASTVPFKLVRRFNTRNKYVRLRLLVAGTSPDFGAVSARIGDADEWNLLSRGQNASSNP